MTLTLTEFASSGLALLLGMIAIIVAMRIRRSGQRGAPYAMAGSSAPRAYRQPTIGMMVTPLRPADENSLEHLNVQYYRADNAATFPLPQVNRLSEFDRPTA